MSAITVLIADKHDLFRYSLRQFCEINGDFQVVAEATSAVELVADLVAEVERRLADRATSAS